MNEKFIKILEGLTTESNIEVEELDEGRGRPKKEVDPNAEPKVAKKRGRPAKSKEDKEDDDLYDGKEGTRDIKLHATISAGKGSNKKSTTDSKVVKDASVDDIKKIVQDFENQMSVKYANKWDVDEDEIDIKSYDSLGWSGVSASDVEGNSVASAEAEENN